MQWCCVVQRRWREVSRLAAKAKGCSQGQGQGQRLVKQIVQWRVENPFRLASGARGVQHRGSHRLVINGRHGQAINSLFPALKPRFDTAHHVEMLYPGIVGQNPAGHTGKTVGGDKQVRTAVLEDVCRFILLQVSTDRGEHNAGSHGARCDFKKLPTVFQHHRHVIAGLESTGPQKMGNLIAALVQLPVGHHLAGIGHDERRFMRGFRGSNRYVGHQYSPDGMLRILYRTVLGKSTGGMFGAGRS